MLRRRGHVANNLRLKVAQAEHDMTQGDLAEAVGATRQTIGLIEAGKYNPSLAFGRIRKEVKMMKFKSVANKVTDERDEAVLNNKVAAECFYIMIVGTLVCLVYGSLFNNGVISADYLLYPLLISSIWSIYRAERLDVNAFGSSSITVLGCLLVTGLITLMIMSANYRYNHDVYHNNPLDPRYLMAWPITYTIYVPFVFLVNWALAALGRFERRRLEKQLDDLENEE